MIKLGTGYFLTSPVFGPDAFQKLMKQVDTFRIPVIAGVVLVRTAGLAHFINRHVKNGLFPAIS